MAASTEEIVVDVPLLALQLKFDETDWSNWRTEPPKISRVHRSLRDVDKEAYEPQIISFGPYHRKDDRFARMEKLKWLYSKKFLARNLAGSLEDYVMEIRRLELRARSAYSEQLNMQRDGFVEMMLLDGCFFLELLLARYVDDEINEESTAVDQFEDPIRSSGWARPTIFEDMLILENQLPFFLLERLMSLSSLQPPFINLAMCPLLSLFMELILPNYDQSENDDHFNSLAEIALASKPYHLLHLLHIMVTHRKPTEEATILQVTPLLMENHGNSSENSKYKSCLPIEFFFRAIRKLRSSSSFESSCLGGKVCERISIIIGGVSSIFVRIFKALILCCCGTRKGSRLDNRILNATKLKEAGVKFMRKEEPRSLLDISFKGNVLEIPQLYLQDHTNSMLRNLIAFEQCCQGVGKDVSHYTSFMNSLIDTPEDVEILQQKEIIHNRLGCNENVASLFNKMGKGVFRNSDESYLIDIIKGVNMFCNKRRNRWRAKLNRDYFGNPWAIVSFIAAVLLLCLTALQTVFAPLSYFRPPA